MQPILFESYCLDIANARLLRGSEPVPLAPKPFAVLSYLVQHSGRLVTKKELLAAVWPRGHVSDASPKVAIRMLRNALQDHSKPPRFIETVHCRGYRFVATTTQAAVAVSQRALAPAPEPLTAAPALDLEAAARDRHFIEREFELGQLQAWLETALFGERRVAFISGELGSGKTTLLDVFLDRIDPRLELWVMRGHCLAEHHGGEPCLPILEALGRLCRGAGSERAIEILRRNAPDWIARIPILLDVIEPTAPPTDRSETTHERNLRQVAEALEAMAAEQPVILVLEDLQWSDDSTLELITYLARRPDPARLLVITTCRTEKVLQPPSKAINHDLQMHRQCVELTMTPLRLEAIEDFLAARWPEIHSPADIPAFLYSVSEGNPFLLISMLDSWMADGLLGSAQDFRDLIHLVDAHASIPECINAVIRNQLDRLVKEERCLLEAGSVSGVEFSAAQVAAALDENLVQTEERCEELARRHLFLKQHGRNHWPDRRRATRYAFIHSIYQRVLCERVTTARRLQFLERLARHGQAKSYSHL